ncbi:amidohydrolase family protein [Microbacterium sp. NPDC077663]|uniref:amidohydrolase family protein n=1 Tax=Microbacterium sp. NPDC077663 TaxID=3364189 RepID=UPI0037C76221
MIDKYAGMASGEPSGYLNVETSADVIDVDLYGDNNGRGAKHHDRMVVDADGFPTQRDLDGTSLTGGRIVESFRWTPERATWSSPADEGSVENPQPRLYIASELSPASVALYAALALRNGGSIDVLPAGTVEVRKIRDVTLSVRPEVPLTAYVVLGLGLLPEVVILDEDYKLIAYWDVVIDFLHEAFIGDDFRAASLEISLLGSDLRAQVAGEIGRNARLDTTDPIRFMNVRVFDPASLTRGEPANVTVFGMRIVSIEPASQTYPDDDDTVEIDGEGGTLVPGLHDMHAHVTVWPALLYTAVGVTSVRDLGNDHAALMANMARWQSGELPGPTKVDYSGFIEGTSPYSANVGFVVGTLEEGLRAARWYARHGYSRVKIYNSMNPEWVAPIAAEARRLGLDTQGHIPAFTNAREMIEAGYHEITHVNQLILTWLLEPGEDTRTLLRLTGLGRAKDFDVKAPEVQEFIAFMKERGIGLDTTLLPMEELLLSRARVGLPSADAPHIEHMPIGFQRKRRLTMLPATDEDLVAFEQAFPKLVELVGEIYRAGLPVWPGTDNGTSFSIHRELELYVEAGIPAPEVLRIATLDAATKLHNDQRTGSIERGKDADFFLVDGDPTANMRDIRKVRAVSNNGTVYFPDKIWEQIGVRPWVTPVQVTRPAPVR